MRLLWFNLATDVDDPVLGFTSRWIQAIATKVERIHVITMRAGRIELPENVRCDSVGKEAGYSRPRRIVEFYRILLEVLRNEPVDACFSHMFPLFTVLAAPLLRPKGVPIVTWYAHPSLTLQLRLAHRLSDQMVTSLPSSYPYDPDKLRVLGQGIDTDWFAPDKTRPQLPALILCAGRLSPVKDHVTLLKAVAMLRQRFRGQFQVVILGNPGRCCTARSKSLTSLCRLQSHPAQYVSGIPSAAILLSISHPIRCSTRCLANVRARISGPMIAL